MNESDQKKMKELFKELHGQIEDPLHKRIVASVISSDEDFLVTMENELSKYLLEVLDHED